MVNLSIQSKWNLRALSKLFIFSSLIYLAALKRDTKLPFEGMPEDVKIIITKNGHSIPHRRDQQLGSQH